MSSGGDAPGLETEVRWNFRAVCVVTRGGGMQLLCLLVLACGVLWAVQADPIISDYELQRAAREKSGGPGISVRQWNATGANGQRTQFTFANISTLLLCLGKLFDRLNVASFLVANPIPHFAVYVAKNSSLPCGGMAIAPPLMLALIPAML